jgi:hypothetical protein
MTADIGIPLLLVGIILFFLGELFFLVAAFRVSPVVGTGVPVSPGRLVLFSDCSLAQSPEAVFSPAPGLCPVCGGRHSQPAVTAPLRIFIQVFGFGVTRIGKGRSE